MSKIERLRALGYHNLADALMEKYKRIDPRPHSKEDMNRSFSFKLKSDGLIHTGLIYHGIAHNLQNKKYFVFKYSYGDYMLVTKEEWFSEEFQKGLVVTHEQI